MANIRFTFLDNSKERSTVTIPLVDVTAINFDEVLGDGATQGRRELEDALVGVTMGTLVRVAADALDEVIPGSPPASVLAQRENGLRVWGRGATTGKLYSITIPTADEVLLRQSGSDEVSLTAPAEMVALVAALNENWDATVSPGVTEAIAVERAAIVGRSN